MTQENEPVEAEKTVDEPKTSNIELTLQDLANLKQIIDVASSRGAFKPKEMVSVGQVYERLETFLTAIEEQQKTQGD